MTFDTGAQSGDFDRNTHAQFDHPHAHVTLSYQGLGLIY